MSITGQNLLDKASYITNDLAHIRWTAAETLGWINSGQRVIVLARPDASASNAAFPLVGGSKQSLPAGHLRLIDVPRNGDGRAVRLIDRGELDRFDPDWHNADPGPTRHYIYDQRDPKHFYVYPPAVAADQVDLITSKAPVDLAALSDPITIDDIYETPLIDYLLYRLFSKNGKGADPGKASAYLNAMSTALGAKVQVDAAAAPNTGAVK